jgi:4-amino-4-deoxy-L-arabinose transferase-like glycosyltransferase
VVPVEGFATPRLEVAADSPAGGELLAYAVSAEGAWAGPLVPLRAAAGAEPRPVATGSGRAALFVLGAAGAPVRIEALRVREEESAVRRRLACGVLLPEAALLLAALLLLAGALVPVSRVPDRWATAAGLLLVVLTALAARAVFLTAYPGPAEGGDAWEYLMRARLLASGEVPFLGSTRWHAWQTWIRPPGYYLYLAGLHLLPGGWQGWLVWSQALFSAAAAGAVYALGLILFGRSAGVAAGLLFALSAESVLTVSRVLGEPLYMLFLAPALVALARASLAPSWRWAAAAGALFGLASYVRSTPVFFVPLAALLLLWLHGPRRGWKPAACLVAALALAVAPWVVRNSTLYSTPVGMDDLSVINLLQSWPDEDVVPSHGADLDDPAEFRPYYNRLKRANADQALTRRSGEITRRALARMLRDPVLTARRFAGNLAGFFGPYDEDWLRRSLREGRICRRILLTDLINAGTYALLALGGLGLVLCFRRREIWPVVAWFLFNAVVVNLFFHPEPKYRFPTLPVAFVLAGAAVAWLVSRRTEDGEVPEEPPAPGSAPR